MVLQIALLVTGALAQDGGAAPVIVVVSPSQADRAMSEALNRFRGEAAAVGFVVTIVPAPKGAPWAQMESVARTVPGVATVAFARGGGADLDVWFTDRLDGQTIVDRVSVESNRADRAVVLAVKAVDVLRARMFRLLARRGPATVTSSPQPPAAASPGPGRSDPAHDEVRAGADGTAGAVAVRPIAVGDPKRMGIALGVGTSRGFAALGRSWLLVVRGQYEATPISVVRLTFMGMGTPQILDAPAGRASVRDTSLMLEGGARPWRGRLRPLLAAGLGLHHLSAEGVAIEPRQSHAVDRWVGAAGLSVGLHATLTAHLAACLEASAQVTFPQAQLAVNGTNTQKVGQPSYLGSFTLEARL